MAGGLKEVRDRIASVKNTQQITKAMKMVSAAKLRRAQQAIQEVRPYATRLNAILRNILATLEEGDGGSAYGVARAVERAAVVVATSDRGLAGAFNTNIAKQAAQLLDADAYRAARAAGQVEVIAVGRKGADYLAKRYPDVRVNRDFESLGANPTFDNAARLAEYLMDRFAAGTLDRVDVAYSRFRNAAMQFPTVAQYLPVAPPEAEEQVGLGRQTEYLYEPSKEELLRTLVPTILQTTLHAYVLDVAAGEHGARMTAMDKATENADELLRDLKISYNKARQEVITSELAEIVGGAAALEG